MKKFRYIIISKRIVICAIAVVGALVLGVFGAAGWNKTLTTGSTDKKLPIYCTEKEDKVVSLSFDAAWGNAKKVQNLNKPQKTRENKSFPCLFLYYNVLYLVCQYFKCQP